MNTGRDPHYDHIDLRTAHRRLICRLWAHGRPNLWHFTVSLLPTNGRRRAFLTDGPDYERPRVDCHDGAHSLWLRSACIGLRCEADAAAAERFIQEHAVPAHGGASRSGAALR